MSPSASLFDAAMLPIIEGTDDKTVEPSLVSAAVDSDVHQAYKLFSTHFKNPSKLGKLF